MDTFLSVDDARQRILSALGTVPVERVMLPRAAGRVLAETVTAPSDSPPFDNSAMDGFAIRHEDLEAGEALPIAGVIAAGDAGDTPLQPGHAVRIMTGAPVPEGADTVVMREHCDDRGETVLVEKAPAPGANIRRRGSDVARDEVVLDVGDRLRGGEIGLLASFGRAAVTVFRRPIVAIVTTGDELVELGQTPGAGQIVNSNAYMLEALVRDHGGDPRVLPIARDNKVMLGQALDQAIRGADLVLTVGGVSVGDYDFVRELLEARTDGMAFWKIRMKPGKPLAFGVTDAGVPIIGLPGNPVSSFVGFHQFARPAMAVLQGIAAADATLPRIHAQLVESARARGDRRYFLTGRLEPGLPPRFRALRNQSSGNLAAMSRIDGFALIDEGTTQVAAGETVVVELI